MMVSALDPYAGWKTGFRDTIVGALNLVKESGVIETVDRFSLKYVNLLQADSVPKQFSMTQLSATLGSRNLLGCLTNIRSEFEEGGFTNIIEMLPNSTAQAPGQKLTGVLLNVDTISFDTKDFWANFETRIDAAHATEKRIFFSMLTPETIDAFGPIYGE